MPNNDEINNDEVLGAMMFEKAKKEYPYLADKDIGFAYTPQEGDRKLEFYSPDEPGSPQNPRPKQLPMGKPGVQVLDPRTSPLDILGDYVSHYAVGQDPQLQALYQQFSGQLDPEKMKQRYQYHQENLGETRPYDQWHQMSGLPEMFRGYTFNQWDNAKEMYTPQQLQVLDQVRKYLGIK